jgi:hypothetical protein
VRVQVITPLQGDQLELFPGDLITTSSGEAIVTGFAQAGQERIIFADYGSGISQPHVQESLLSPEQKFEIGDKSDAFAVGDKSDALAVGDRVQVIRGCCSGLTSIVTAIDPNYAHSIALEPGKGRFKPSMLEKISRSSPPEQLPGKSSQPQRRHSPKGQATGWIEERIGNKQRKNPCTSYYYCWQEGERRMKVYVKARKMYRLQQMVEARCSVGEILSFLNG